VSIKFFHKSSKLAYMCTVQIDITKFYYFQERYLYLTLPGLGRGSGVGVGGGSGVGDAESSCQNNTINIIKIKIITLKTGSSPVKCKIW
jgi:hypothetical protein